MQIHSYSKNGINIEFTTIKSSIVREDFRMDSNYYSPKYLIENEKINNKNWKYLQFFISPLQKGKLVKNSEEETKNATPYVLIDNLRGSKYEYFTEEINGISCNESNILIAGDGENSGEIGTGLKGFLGSTLFKFSVKKQISKNYIFTFLKYNFEKLNFLKTGSGVPHLDKKLLLNLKIPIPSSESKLQEKIEEIVKLAYAKKEESEKLYEEAENILLEELGLLDYQPETIEIDLYNGYKVRVNKFMNIKTVKEVRETDRLDAQYYLPEYEVFEKKILEYKNGYTLFSHLVRHIKKGKLLKNSEEKTENSVPYVLISNLRGSEYTSFTEELNGVSCAKEDILIVGDGSKSGEVGTDVEGFVGSTLYMMKLRQEKLNKYALLNILKMYFKKLNDLKTGSGVPHLDKRVLMSLKIPFLKSSVQNTIAESVQASKHLKQESKELLEKVKKAVEIFIEEDEWVAMEFLKK